MHHGRGWAPQGEPVVPNGLCKIHHAAFDADLIGVSPEYTVKVPRSILQETDGPMLHHGLKDLEGSRIILPHRHQDLTDRDRLAKRFEQFQQAVS
jgi:putative restriction endonuclease